MNCDGKSEEDQANCDGTPNGNKSESSQLSFTKAIQHIPKVGSPLVSTLMDIHTHSPDKISLEFGLTFNADYGVMFTHVENSEAVFKVNITWDNNLAK